MDSDQLILKYFPELTFNERSQIEKLGSLYREWNDKVNVISRKDIDHLYERHILHSLSIIKFMRFKPGQQILDVGTGGGFPGIPLAIVLPDTQFHLIDSIGKKITVVRDIISELGLQNVRAEQVRVEKHKTKYQFVVTRAVARSRQLIMWIQKNIAPPDEKNTNNGLIALKGGDLKQELNELKRMHQVTDLSRYFSEPFFETKKLVYIPL